MNENNDELNLSGEFDELDNKIILNDEDGNEMDVEYSDKGVSSFIAEKGKVYLHKFLAIFGTIGSAIFLIFLF